MDSEVLVRIRFVTFRIVTSAVEQSSYYYITVVDLPTCSIGYYSVALECEWEEKTRRIHFFMG